MLFPHPMNVNDLLKPIPKVQKMTIGEPITALDPSHKKFNSSAFERILESLQTLQIPDGDRQTCP